MKKLFLIIAILFATISSSIAQSTPYVLLVSFDAFRWDYMDRNITPNLDKMVEDGVRALTLRPTFPSKTFPNHQSIITGMYPEHHGIILNGFSNPYTKDFYSICDTAAVRNSKWYLGEAFWETAERHGITTASYYWPGSELHEPHRHPTYFMTYNHYTPYEERVEKVIDWLQLPQAERPHFITLYFPDTDDYGHEYGPNSEEINESIMRLDNIAGLINNKIEEIGLKDSVNIIILSDHGMTEISKDRIILLHDLLKNQKCKSFGSGPVVFVEPYKNSLQEVYSFLKENRKNYQVYTKKNIPDYYHYSEHPFISSIILIADPGWEFVSERDLKRGKYSKGDHGFDKDFLDMHGFFVAKGPAFKNGYKTGSLWNIDIYPLLCKIFEIQPRINIDGKLERIGFILEEE